MKLFSLLPLLFLIICSGCQTDKPLESGAALHDAADSSVDSGAGNSSLQGEARLGTPTEESVTRRDLDQHLQRFQAAVWHYRERTDGELAGTWISSDGDRLVFDAEGVKGSFREDFNGNMAEGLYAISDEGLIATYSMWNGNGLGSHFRLEGQAIVGPKGPNPSVKWKRLDTTE